MPPGRSGAIEEAWFQPAHGPLQPPVLLYCADAAGDPDRETTAGLERPSDLFLDTELHADDFRRITAALRASGYTPAELRAILADEVGPAFVFNLLDVAGEWSGWTEDAVKEIMIHSLRSSNRMPPLTWLKRRLCKRHIAEAGKKIEALLDDETGWPGPGDM